MIFVGSGLSLGLLLTVPREYKHCWIWLGAAVAMLLFLPNLLWEMYTGWPTIAAFGDWYQIRDRLTVDVHRGAAPAHPTALGPHLVDGSMVPAAGPGRPPVRRTRSYILDCSAEMLILHGKIYYLAPAYVMLLAAGSVWFEKQTWFTAKRWVAPAAAVNLIVAAVIAAPLTMPILPVNSLAHYARFWDVQAVRVENVPQDDLPQLFGDMFGWPEQVATVAKVFEALPSAERAHTTIAAYNYGEASAIDYFGPAYGLPPAVSGHNQYGFWGPGGNSNEVVVAIGYREGFLRQFFDDVQRQATMNSRHALPEERNVAIFICREPKADWATMWARWKYLD
jgi:hypothetical protein